MNGVLTSAECGRSAVKDAQIFFREHMNSTVADSGGSEVLAVLDRAGQTNSCLDEINADCLAIDHLLTIYTIADITPEFVADMIVQQFSLLVGATFFGLLNMEMDAFARGCPIPTNDRMQVESMARTYVAISRIIKYGAHYVSVKYGLSKNETDKLTEEFVECFTHVNNGSRYIEEAIKTDWALHMLEGADQYVKSEEFIRQLDPSVQALPAREKNLTLALSVLVALGWPMEMYQSMVREAGQP